jgi:hypothetical protein
MNTHFSIQSHEGALPLRFGMTEAGIISVLGAPQKKNKNWKGTLCLYYPFLTIGLGGAGNTADHFGFTKGAAVSYQDISFFSDLSAWKRLQDQDKEIVECVGFLVFLGLGIALSGFHDDYQDELAVVAFARGGYDKLRGHFKPWKTEVEPSGAANGAPHRG